MIRMSKPKATLYGRALSDDELVLIKQRVESFGTIETINDELLALVAEHWPELLAKLRKGKPN